MRPEPRDPWERLGGRDRLAVLETQDLPEPMELVHQERQAPLDHLEPPVYLALLGLTVSQGALEPPELRDPRDHREPQVLRDQQDLRDLAEVRAQPEDLGPMDLQGRPGPRAHLEPQEWVNLALLEPLVLQDLLDK